MGESIGLTKILWSICVLVILGVLFEKRASSKSRSVFGHST